MSIRNRKAQSSIEYLTTYGWMVIAVSLVGATIFTQIDIGGCEVQTSGFNPPSPIIGETGWSQDDSLLMSVENPRDEPIELREIEVIEDNQTVASIDLDKSIPGRADAQVSTDRFDRSENCNNRDLEVEYSSAGITQLKATGDIEGLYDIVGLVGSIEVSPAAPDANQTVEFNASDSYSENGVESYIWDFGNGETASGETASTSYERAGVYTVELEVTDVEGNRASESRQIFVGGIVRNLGGSLIQINLSNTLASGCLGGECDTVDGGTDDTVSTAGDSIAGTLYVRTLYMAENRLCVTSQNSLGSDDGCSKVRKGQDLQLSQENNQIFGSLKTSVIKPATDKLCIGECQ